MSIGANMQQLVCPGCDRTIRAVDGRYDTHHAVAGQLAYCFMSGMPTEVSGRDEAAMQERAKIVACLAMEVQEADPHAVWKYLEVMPETFVRELLQVALAGLNVDGQRVSDIWKGWGVE